MAQSLAARRQKEINVIGKYTDLHYFNSKKELSNYKGVEEMETCGETDNVWGAINKNGQEF